MSSIAFRNPDGIFGPDPFGARLSPDFAIRIIGLVELFEDGEYTFRARSHEGVRVEMDGEELLTIAGGRSRSQEQDGQRKLKAGLHRIMLTYYATVGAPEIALSIAKDGGAMRPVESNRFWNEEIVVTSENGVIAFDDLPAWMQVIRFVTPDGPDFRLYGSASGIGGRARPVVVMKKSRSQAVQ